MEGGIVFVANEISDLYENFYWYEFLTVNYSMLASMTDYTEYINWGLSAKLI